MRKRLPLIIGLLLVALCGYGGFSFMQQGRKAAEMMAGKVETATVKKDAFQIKVVETGTVDAIKAVDVKSRAGGRLAKLLVQEGDFVQKGQLIAVIDPQETELQVAQNRARLRGAQSSTQRIDIELEQRRITAKAAYDQALARVAQLEKEVRLQPTLTNVAITQAQADLASLRQERQRLVGNVHPNQRTGVKSTLDQARANAENAKLEYERQLALLDRGFVAGREVDSAKLTLDVANVRLQAAQEEMNRLESSLRLELSKLDEQIRQSQATLTRAQANRVQDSIKDDELRSARAAAETARANLKDVESLQKQREEGQATVDQLASVLGDSERQLSETRIIAPLSGIVSKRYVEEGDLVTGQSSFGQGTSIMRVEDRSIMRVKLNVNEIDVARMSVGMPATVEVDAIPTKAFKGIVMKIAPASSATGAGNQPTSTDVVVRYEVEINLQDKDEKLRSGMSAKCSLNVVDRKDVLQLPAQFVGQEGTQRYIELPLAKGAKPGTKPERVNVKVGLTTAAKVEILEGVKEGTEVAKPGFSGPDRRGFMSGPGDN